MIQPTVLFLCTGNYYRSRFAEILFNHHARLRKLIWIATSSGLAPERNIFAVGSISVHTVSALKMRGIESDQLDRAPCRVTDEELRSASLVIAVKEAEHRPLLRDRHAGWERRVTYWNVHDLDGATPDAALCEIETCVLELIDELAALPT